ncbi:TetR family transcriptional regulator [Nocardiopsis exhalans]|uniref:AcrR family transcriptional regulator n=2 Tax=Nocardiopsis TaxID=2013 RepID=A0A840WDT9_9ACTN|nr:MULTISPECIES: TetR family transcriptional regulator [Nocardiopsis]MBB5494294.1 AcrR family transcriptional regulator [Nocardiopsis metallicus]USY20615.1 TetR family transcriptional regulator [Nocardiopsis exhalans]
MAHWREQKRERTRNALREAAFRLFAEHGYEDTTVARIAAEAGVSHMTFFRYFPTKEDVVLRDDYDPLLEELIRAEPPDKPALRRVRDAVMSAVPAVYAREREALLLRSRLLLTTPALRSRMGESMDGSRSAFERGLSDPEAAAAPPMAARVVASACTAALATAITVWVEQDGETDLPALMEQAFDALENPGARNG